MKAIEIKIARRMIISKGYTFRRLALTSRLLVQWMGYEQQSTTATHRDCCRRMERMYFRRCQYYAKTPSDGRRGS